MTRPPMVLLAEAAGERADHVNGWWYYGRPDLREKIPGIASPLTLADVGVVLTWLASAGCEAREAYYAHAAGFVVDIVDAHDVEATRSADTLPAALQAAVESLYEEQE